MDRNRFGEIFSVVTFGESHGPAMGAVIDGCPAGLEWRQAVLEDFLKRRRPGQNAVVSSRVEPDSPEILSGVYNGLTLGTPIAILIRNLDAKSKDYTSEKLQMRQGHATDLWQSKFGHSDPRGSGRASGRETVSRVLGGAVAKMLVEKLHPQVRVLAFASQIGPIRLEAAEAELAIRDLSSRPWDVDHFSTRFPAAEKNLKIEQLMVAAKESGESYGGVAAIRVLGLPSGLGQPVFLKLKSQLATALMSVGATAGFSIGDFSLAESDTGHAADKRVGSDFHNSEQQYGGIRGGISTGDPISLNVAFKPTSTINKMAKEGRHDPCIVPRAIPVLEAMVWLVLADQVLMRRTDCL
jgi:chorismate synthase